MSFPIKFDDVMLAASWREFIYASGYYFQTLPNVWLFYVWVLLLFMTHVENKNFLVHHLTIKHVMDGTAHHYWRRMAFRLRRMSAEWSLYNATVMPLLVVISMFFVIGYIGLATRIDR